MEEINSPPEIQTLVKFLLNNGGPVISGHTKFSVTPQILKQMNIILEKLKKDIYVTSLTNADLINKYAKKNELMFLYDFVKKTPKLKISNTASSHDFNVDITDFSNLKYLELYKFNVKLVKNLQFLRNHLEMVVCVRSIENVGDLFLCPESDSDSNMWSKLKHVILSRNDIPTLDQSFIYTPWLQYLDISYNHLTDLRPLTCLRNLTYLNASYNRLTEIPPFTLFELKILLLSYNHISDISGISKLKNLQECDFSGNCISQHVDLLPLADLPSLISLNLTRNPISCDPRHRSFACGYLHENVLDQYFLLDGRPLVPSEKQFIRRCSREVINKFTPRLRTPSTSSFSNDDNSYAEYDQPIVGTRNSRKRTVRAAVIKDNVSEEDDKERFDCSTPVEPEAEDGEHIEVKKQIELLRTKYGEDGWLHGSSASVVQNLLNIETPTSQTPTFGAGVPISHIFNSESSASITNIVFDNSTKEESYMEQIPAQIDNETMNETNETVEAEPTISVYETAVSSSSSSSSEESDSEEDDDVDLWLVERLTNKNESECIFLSLTETELKERNKKDNKIITKWRIHQIERCVKISLDPVIIYLAFDAARRNDRTRTYKMEYADAQKLVDRFEQELNQKTLKEFNTKLLHCMKCGAYCCVEIRSRASGFIEQEPEYKCSVCGSVAVIEEDEAAIQPKLNVEVAASPVKKSPLSSKPEKVTQSPSLSSIGSAASLDQNNDIGGASDLQTNNHESDIEIISNPSQSSIEVLEIHGSDNSKTVLKIVDKPAPAVTPASTNNSYNYILTESSSSGSMTDSICTSYETNYPKRIRGGFHASQSTVNEMQGEESTGTSPKKSVTNMERRDSERRIKLDFSTVLGDVIQSVSSKIISSSPRKTGTVKGSDAYQYSFDNFSYIDPRIKLDLWDKHIPTNEDILAFLRTETIIKNVTPCVTFAGFLVFTSKNMYIMRITKEEIGDPSTWLEKFESINMTKVELIETVCMKQGILIECVDRSLSDKKFNYLVLIQDQERTTTFLSFIKKLDILSSDKIRDICDENMPSIPQLEENIKYFILSESIIVYKINNEESSRHSLAGFAFTETLCLILKCETNWFDCETSEEKTNNITVEHEVNLLDLVAAKDKRTALVLHFVDERKGMVEYFWHIKTGLGMNSHIIDLINALWQPLYSMTLPVSRSAD